MGVSSSGEHFLLRVILYGHMQALFGISKATHETLASFSVIVHLCTTHYGRCHVTFVGVSPSGELFSRICNIVLT